jgi:hypothetical protein
VDFEIQENSKSAKLILAALQPQANVKTIFSIIGDKQQKNLLLQITKLNKHTSSGPY